MSYDFSFNKKTITFALAGFAFVGILLFIAGLLVGTNWKAEPNAAPVVAAKPPVVAPPPPPAAPPIVQPDEPALRADAARPEAVAPNEADTTGAASSPAKQAHSNAASIYSQRWFAPASAPQNDGELKIIQEAEPAANDDAEPTSFSVQVGMFDSENEAHQLVRQLQKKGYTPIVLAANDDESRLWYAVRIGAYTDKTEATQAASNITAQEKLKAVVRPLGAL